jgi:hypothetical protein
MEFRLYRKVLRLVTELHVRGFQRLRKSLRECHRPVAPGGARSRRSPTFRTGTALACCLGIRSLPTTRARRNGSILIGTMRPHATPSRLAELFLERFPHIVEAGPGSDWGMLAGIWKCST